MTLDDGTNPHGTTTTDVGADPAGTASGLVGTHESTYTHSDIAHTNRTALDAVTNTNTGDQDLSTLALKTNVLELDNTAAFTPDADYEPATKKYVDDNGSLAPNFLLMGA